MYENRPEMDFQLVSELAVPFTNGHGNWLYNCQTEMFD